MNLIRGFKREVWATDWRICLLIGLCACLLCGGVLWLAGGAATYRQICGDCIVPIPAAWLICRQCTALLLGLALGIILGRQSCCCVRGRIYGIVWWTVGYVAMLLWLLLFLSGKYEVLAVILLAFSICALAIALDRFARESLLSATVLLVGILWIMGSFGFVLRIILWN